MGEWGKGSVMKTVFNGVCGVYLCPPDENMLSLSAVCVESFLAMLLECPTQIGSCG